MKLPQKLKSRKLFVWIVWTVISVSCLFADDLPNETIFQFYGFISLLYIGSNTAQKWIEAKKPPEGK